MCIFPTETPKQRNTDIFYEIYLNTREKINRPFPPIGQQANNFVCWTICFKRKKLISFSYFGFLLFQQGKHLDNWLTTRWRSQIAKKVVAGYEKIRRFQLIWSLNQVSWISCVNQAIEWTSNTLLRDVNVLILWFGFFFRI